MVSKECGWFWVSIVKQLSVVGIEVVIEVLTVDNGGHKGSKKGEENRARTEP